MIQEYTFNFSSGLVCSLNFRLPYSNDFKSAILSHNSGKPVSFEQRLEKFELDNA